MLPYDSYKLPEPGEGGYELDERWGAFSVLVPEARTNLFTNPSFEGSTTNATAVGSGTTMQISFAAACRGVYGLAVTPGSGATCGVYIAVTPTVSNVNYAYSLDIQGLAGAYYSLYVTDGSGTTLSKVYRFKANGFWQRVSVLYNEGTAAARRMYITRDTAGITNTFYVDCVQCEQGDYPTTYIDGDQPGFVVGQQAYTWNGRANASTSSRISDTGSGGREVFLKDIGLKLLGAVGLGMPGYNYAATSLVVGGEIYQKSIIKSRDFSLVFALFGDTQEELSRGLSAVSKLFVPPQLQTDQEITLRYHRTDINGNDTQPVIEMPCRYVSGLEEVANNPVQMRFGVSLRAPNPVWREVGQTSQQIDYKLDLKNRSWTTYFKDNVAYSVGANAAAGNTGITGPVYCYTEDKNGNIWMGGNFVYTDGTLTGRLCYYDPSTNTFTIQGTGANDHVHALLYYIEQDKIFLGGNFTTLNGSAYPYAGIYDITAGTFADIKSGGTNTGTVINSIVRDSNGYIYLGGDFTVLRGISSNYLFRYDPRTSTVAAITSTLNGAITAMAVSKDGTKIHVIGSFTTPSAGFATYDTVNNTWITDNSITGTTSWTMSSIVVDKNDAIYVGTSGIVGVGSPDYHIWKKNGANFVGVFKAPSSRAHVNSLSVGLSNEVVAGGDTYVNKSTWPTFYWSGNNTFYTFGNKNEKLEYPFIMTSFYEVNSIFCDSRGGLFVNTNIDYIEYAKKNTISINSSAGAQSKINIAGPGLLMFLKVNNQNILQTSIQISPSDTVTISFDGGLISITSKALGNLSGYIVPGAAGYQVLSYGVNTVTVFMANDYYESTDSQVNQWNLLTGITQSNSDNGKLYCSVTNPSGSNYQINLYSDAARSVLVGHSDLYTTSGTVVINADGGSGLGGYLNTGSPSVVSNIVVQMGMMSLTQRLVYRSLTEAIR